jgi:hypothetical protein
MSIHHPNQPSHPNHMNHPNDMNHMNHPNHPHRPSRHRWRCRRCRMQLGSHSEGRLRIPLGVLRGAGRGASRCPRCRTWNVITFDPEGFHVARGLRAAPPFSD